MTPQENNFEHVAAEIGALVAEKNRAYGRSFDKCGDFLRLLWPNGIAPEQYTDALAMVRIFDKQMRIATDKHALGESPYRDIAGYAILGVVKDARETARAAFTPVQDPCAKCATGECNEHKEIAAKLAGTCEDRATPQPSFPFTFPPALKWMGKDEQDYDEKLIEEVDEVVKAENNKHRMIELFDVIQTAETAIRDLAEKTGLDPAEAAAAVFTKNQLRRYYSPQG